jgi:CRP-like cAMP-binding protein
MASEPLSAPDRELLRRFYRKVSPLGDDEVALVDSVTRLHRFARGQACLAAGTVAVDCGIVLRGVMREYYPLADGGEVTRGFAGPGDGIGSLSDLLSGQPARASVVAEADVEAAVVPWSHLRAIADRVPAWGRFLAQITERLYLAKATREYELLALDAEQRYLQFRTRYASIEATVALRHVASYVGVTPEHLSRLRKRLGVSRSC